MVTNARIADLIREGKGDEVTDAIADGSFAHCTVRKLFSAGELLFSDSDWTARRRRSQERIRGYGIQPVACVSLTSR